MIASGAMRRRPIAGHAGVRPPGARRACGRGRGAGPRGVLARVLGYSRRCGARAEATVYRSCVHVIKRIDHPRETGVVKLVSF